MFCLPPFFQYSKKFQAFLWSSRWFSIFSTGLSKLLTLKPLLQPCKDGLSLKSHMAMKPLISSPGRCFSPWLLLPWAMHFAHCSQVPPVYFLFLTLPLFPQNGFPASQQDYRDICMEPTRLWFKHAPLSATRNASMLGITLLPQDMEPTRLWFKHAPLPATSNASMLGTIFLPQGQLWAHLWATALVVDEVLKAKPTLGTSLGSSPGSG